MTRETGGTGTGWGPEAALGALTRPLLLGSKAAESARGGADSLAPLGYQPVSDVAGAALTRAVQTLGLKDTIQGNRSSQLELRAPSERAPDSEPGAA